MPKYRFYHPIDVRYGDLDPQGHVNNAKYLTYFEQARIAYIMSLGLWKTASFSDIGVILADAQVTFKAPVYFGTDLLVDVRVTRLGTKSMTMEYVLEEACSGREYATGVTVLVTYDYKNLETIPIPEKWRTAIAEFERLAAAGANS
ncbi:MAG: acyl-CoA thioesterase [Chloroflexota bacterium]